MLPMSNLMGRQLGLECLRVETRFINGQKLLECLGCRGYSPPAFFIWSGQDRLGLVNWSRLAMTGHQKTDPRVLSLTAGTYILPNKIYFLK